MKHDRRSWLGAAPSGGAARGAGAPPVRVIPGGGEARLPLHKGVYILPNLFTTGGLFLGVYSIIASSRGDFLTAAVCIVAAHVFDGLDGRIARLTHTTSQFGVEYDSLADLVAFGVAPGIMVYLWGLEPWGHWGWLAASLFVACGALRLARFNVQAHLAEKKYFIGLPIPAAADMIAATVLLYYFLGGQGPTSQRLVVLGLVYVLALLMVSNVRYYSFKDVNVRAHKPFFALVAAIILFKLVILEPQIALFAAMVAYVSSGPVSLGLSMIRRHRRRASRLSRRTPDDTIRGASA